MELELKEIHISFKHLKIWLHFFFTKNSVPNHIPPLVETARDRLYVTNLNRFSRTFNIHSVYLGRLVGNTGALKWILLLYDIFAKTPFSLEFFLYMDSQRRKADVNLIWVGHLWVFLYISYMCEFSAQLRFILIKRNFWTKIEIKFVKERQRKPKS